MSGPTIKIKLGNVVEPKHGLNVDEAASKVKFVEELRRRMGEQFPRETLSVEWDRFMSPGGADVAFTELSVDRRGNVVNNSGVADVVANLRSDEAAWLVRKKE